MSSNVKSYFEIHAHNYLKEPEFYLSITNQIKNIIPQNSSNIKFLDVGCGNGNFIKAIIKSGIKADYFATDISFKMIRMSKENLDGCNVELFVADAFKIPLNPNMKYDIIHIDSVLHHLIGKTRSKSTNLIKKMVELLTRKLSDNGILIVEEVYYGSLLIPQFTSFVVFYGLKLINFLNLDFSSFTKEIKPGLEVNFLHEKQLVKILGLYGSPYLVHKTPWKGIPKSYQLFLLKDFGHITYIVKNTKYSLEKDHTLEY